jgi:hypothetical protein
VENASPQASEELEFRDLGDEPFRRALAAKDDAVSDSDPCQDCWGARMFPKGLPTDSREGGWLAWLLSRPATLSARLTGAKPYSLVGSEAPSADRRLGWNKALCIVVLPFLIATLVYVSKSEREDAVQTRSAVARGAAGATRAAGAISTTLPPSPSPPFRATTAAATTAAPTTSSPGVLVGAAAVGAPPSASGHEFRYEQRSTSDVVGRLGSATGQKGFRDRDAEAVRATPGVTMATDPGVQADAVRSDVVGAAPASASSAQTGQACALLWGHSLSTMMATGFGSVVMDMPVVILFARRHYCDLLVSSNFAAEWQRWRLSPFWDAVVDSALWGDRWSRSHGCSIGGAAQRGIRCEGPPMVVGPKTENWMGAAACDPDYGELLLEIFGRRLKAYQPPHRSPYVGIHVRRGDKAVEQRGCNSPMLCPRPWCSIPCENNTFSGRAAFAGGAARAGAAAGGLAGETAVWGAGSGASSQGVGLRGVATATAASENTGRQGAPVGVSGQEFGGGSGGAGGLAPAGYVGATRATGAAGPVTRAGYLEGGQPAALTLPPRPTAPHAFFARRAAATGRAWAQPYAMAGIAADRISMCSAQSQDKVGLAFVFSLQQSMDRLQDQWPELQRVFVSTDDSWTISHRALSPYLETGYQFNWTVDSPRWPGGSPFVQDDTGSGLEVKHPHDEAAIEATLTDLAGLARATNIAGSLDSSFFRLAWELNMQLHGAYHRKQSWCLDLFTGTVCNKESKSAILETYCRSLPHNGKDCLRNFLDTCGPRVAHRGNILQYCTEEQWAPP